MNNCVFIQTNHKQIVGALVAEYALRRNYRHNDKFDVHVVNTNDYPFFKAREGQLYLHDGVKRTWLNDDLEYRPDKRPFPTLSADHPRVTKAPMPCQQPVILPYSALTV